MGSGLPRPLRFYIALTTIGGAACLAYLVSRADWSLSTLGETALFFLLVVVAGSFPLPVAPRVKTDVTTAVLFGAALLLDPGAAALAGAAGIVTYTLLLRFWGEKLRLPWYKYPFNAGAVSLYVGATSVVFGALAPEETVLSTAALPAAVVMYFANTALVTGAASLQTGMNPLRFWWTGTKENGPAEISLFAFGFLGALAYQESRWTIVALLIPVAVIYLAFSRLARANDQLQEALVQLEALQGRIASTSKLASVGAMSMDMAHQIKNPLAILLGRLETLQDRVEEGTPARRHLDLALEAGWRIRELTQTFTSMGHQKWVPLAIGEVLNEAFGIAGIAHRARRVEARWDIGKGLPKVSGNPVLLREAFSNIFSNALEAVRDGGLIATCASEADGKVVVRISDSGPGIPQEVMAHLFEPFRSTKPHGSGLGLFAAKHILEMHQGSLGIETATGQGTSATVTLPAAPPQAGNGLQGNSDTPLQGRSQ